MLGFWNVLWFILIFVVLTGYFILDGFDLGVGALYPFLGKSEEDKAVMRRAVGPVWDGNEVWLLTGGGALFAAFAPAYATTFSGFYLAIMLVLFSLIIRAVSIESRNHDPEHAKLWDTLFFIGSALPALLFGVAVGNVLQGLPLDAQGNYNVAFPLGFVLLLKPFPLACGLLGLAQFLVLGASWIAVKSTGDLHDRAVELRSKLLIAVLVLFVLATLLYFLFVPSQLDTGAIPTILRIVFAVVVVAAAGGAFLIGRDPNKDLLTFIVAALVCCGLLFLAAFSLFPNWIPAAVDSVGPAITIAEAASEDPTLIAMTIITVIGLPILLFYHFLCYRAFAGKITAEDLDY